MVDGAAPSLHDQLQRLAEQFTEHLRQELPELAELCARLADQPADEQRALLQDLRSRLHRLAGSAGTFGFVELGEHARSLELQLHAWLDQPAPASPLPDLGEPIRLLNQLLQAQSAAAHPDASPRLHGQRIYILEDEAGIGESMCQTLRSFGYDVRHFTDCASLDTALDTHLPDALIIDADLCVAGDGDCLGYAESLQQRLERPLRLLVISNGTDFASHLRAVRAGAVGYFVKPVDLAQLENRLERCFSQQSGEPYRVLIVDDDEHLAVRYALVLRNAKMLVEVLHDPTQALRIMEEFQPEVLLLDMYMPECSGAELAQIIRLNDDWLRVPIIYLSGETDIGKQMDALLKGGDNFVSKPISDNALVAAVFSHAQRARLLSDALSRDSLTGLLKHADIKEQVTLGVERARRCTQPASVVMIDIDHFKQVNDRYGHATGDNVIRALANLLRQRLRKVDSLGRYGGEEFVAVLPDCDGEQAKRIIDEIREHFAELSFGTGDQAFSVTLSAGIASTLSHCDAAELLEKADQALYVAKNGGRNRVCLDQ